MEIKNNVVVMNFLEGDIEANKQQVLELAKDSSKNILLSSNRQKAATINNTAVLDLLSGKDGYTNIEATDTLLEKLNVENFGKIGTHNLRNHAMAIAGNGPIDRQEALINELKDELNITEVTVKNRKVLAVKSADYPDSPYCKLEYGNINNDNVIALSKEAGSDGAVLNFKLAENDLADKLTDKAELIIKTKENGVFKPNLWDTLLDLNGSPTVEELLTAVYNCHNDIDSLTNVLDNWFRAHGYRADHFSGDPKLLGPFEYQYKITFEHGENIEEVGILVISGFDEEV